jgi:hypothetical protein
MSLRGVAARLSCLILILSSLTCVGVCFADMPNPGPQKHDVEIQGAKIISEGGYLWFHVVNHDYRGVFVAIHPPSGVTMMENTSSVAYLNTNEVADFYFQVYYFWSGNPILVQQGPTKELKFFFEIYTQYRTSKMTDENVEFNVNAVPLNYKADDWNLFYFAVVTLAAVIVTVIVIVARLSRQRSARAYHRNKHELNLKRTKHSIFFLFTDRAKLMRPNSIPLEMRC